VGWTRAGTGGALFSSLNALLPLLGLLALLLNALLLL
jgi:hypothetical protein